METLKSLLIIGIMVWIVYRVFILSKKIVKGWDKRRKNENTNST